LELKSLKPEFDKHNKQSSKERQQIGQRKISNGRRGRSTNKAKKNPAMEGKEEQRKTQQCMDGEEDQLCLSTSSKPNNACSVSTQ